MSAQQLLDQLRATHSACTACPLHEQAIQGVPGIGSLNPKVLFLGEAPGADEDRVGKPFVGRAGKLLQQILQDLDVTMEDIYVTNVAKHRPPGNRNPTEDEMKACAAHALTQEILLVDPQVIVCLGRVPTTALHLLEQLRLPKKSLRGYTFRYRTYRVISTWHPAYILRRADKKQELVDDIYFAFEAANEALQI